MSERLFKFKDFYLPGNFLPQREKQEIYDQLKLMQKEFANEIYIQRCKEKYL